MNSHGRSQGKMLVGKSGMRGEIIATGRCGQPCLRKYSAVHLWILQSKNDMVQFKVVSSTRIIISGCDL